MGATLANYSYRLLDIFYKGSDGRKEAIAGYDATQQIV